MIKVYKRPHNAMKGVLFALFLLVNTGTLAAPQSSANQNNDNDFSKANQLLFMIYDQRTAEAFAGAYPLPEEPSGVPHVLEGALLEELVRQIQNRLNRTWSLKN